uniref:DUF1640 domain-containing protein n=1 Tax=Candidatus Kentrum sp. FM TaxID=2126340 RepID=A0A450T064_9GAMM|nr:MAG: hypothetical protein BECKFM1743C_GA0114222_100376 [Candidatus Kentron sp. FM]VFJ59899.1 MAG: hypothetical protein BECKFM1743A_GA0114220_102494 [Candidatus Kentron sp. FM]VFK11656.1 MAG: hypothetical protein BECKFM1743B_GA0114221_102003 [Candidatus Kentron sp. FM]
MTAITFDVAKFTEEARTAGAPAVIVNALIDLARQENTRQKEEPERLLEIEEKRERIQAEIQKINVKQEAVERSLEQLTAREPITRGHLDLRLDAAKMELRHEISEIELELKQDVMEFKTDIIKWTAGIIAVQSVGILIGCATIIKVFS